jgi:hypothetical protein
MGQPAAKQGDQIVTTDTLEGFIQTFVSPAATGK